MPLYVKLPLQQGCTEGIPLPMVCTLSGKPGKMREVFPVREKYGNFKIFGILVKKVREF